MRRRENIPRETRELMEAAGYSLKRTSNHLIWFNPALGTQVVTSLSPSDHRSLMNIRSTIKRVEREALERA